MFSLGRFAFILNQKSEISLNQLLANCLCGSVRHKYSSQFLVQNIFARAQKFKTGVWSQWKMKICLVTMSRLAKSVCPNVTLGLRLVWLLLGPPPVSHYSYCMSHIYAYTNKSFSYIEAVECYEKQHQQSATVQKEGCVAFVVYPCAFVILTIFIKSICTDSMGIKKNIPWIIKLNSG